MYTCTTKQYDRTMFKSILAIGIQAIVASTLVVAPLCAIAEAEKTVRVSPRGKKTPDFELTSITGWTISPKALSGKTALLVVGQTEKSAPRCKTWILSLFKELSHTNPELFQVIIADKPWFYPKSAVIDRVKNFTPDWFHSRVLMEWGRKFAEVFDIPKDDDPRLILVDPEGIVRWTYRGEISPAALQNAITAYQRYRADPLQLGSVKNHHAG